MGLLCRTTQLKLEQLKKKLEQLYSEKKKPTCFITEVEEMVHKLFLWVAYVWMQSIRLCRKRDTADPWHL